jgi:selenocysteine lyase/cysteine desulfurase
VKFIADRDWAEDPARSLRASLKPGIRVFCTSWVDSFTGRILDLHELGRICHANGTSFVVNVSQGLGNRLFSLSGLPVDALSCSGSKWLCGPYGTGFAWISDRLISEMSPVQYYWQANRTEAALMEGALAFDVAYPTYDVFATANFFNYVPWTSAVECLLETGIGAIAKHVDEWVLAFRGGLKASPYEVSGGTGSALSALIIITHQDATKNQTIYEQARSAGIDVALRRGKIRISPHFFVPLEAAQRTSNLLRSFS